MSNIIRYHSYYTLREKLTMSNQGTDCLLELILNAVKDIEMSTSQIKLVDYLADRRYENDIAPGTASFDVEEMPWNEDTFQDDIRFMLNLIMKAKDRGSWKNLGFEPNEQIVIPWLDQFAKMIKNHNTVKKAHLLDEVSMFYETFVLVLPADNYPERFYDFYRFKNRNHKLITSPDSFHDTLKEVSGYDRWQPIAEKTESLFGFPKRVTVFEDVAPVVNQLEGKRGRGPGPFFFIFDLMFCEYEDYALCFISGTNN